MPNFKKPHVMKKREGGKGQVIDWKESEVFFMYETLGNPAVIYGCRNNRYYKDLKCENLFSDTEIQALGLPIPAEIDSARKKLIKATIDAGDVPDMMQVFLATAPKQLEYPARLRDKILETPAEERIIGRLNRASSKY